MSDIQHPTLNEHGKETHPAFGMIGVSRGQHSPPGAVLFDSDLRHQNIITVRISEATRNRDLNRDWLSARREFVEVTMSEAQWASFVSSMNLGSGVPCTITSRDHRDVPRLPYEPRMKESMDEVRSAARKATEEVSTALEAYKAHKTVGNLRHLEAVIANLPSNLVFAGESLSEHTENVVQKARADIEAMVVAKAEQLGIEPGELGVNTAQLTEHTSGPIE